MRTVPRIATLAALALSACNPDSAGGGGRTDGGGGGDDCAPDVAGEQVLVTLYADLDGDGFTVAEGVEQCVDAGAVPSGYLTEPTALDDCDDTSSAINPFATEIDGDGIDQNCDGVDPEPLTDNVLYVNSADPNCQDQLRGTLEAPNCTITAAGEIARDGNVIQVASDGEYWGERITTGRTYLGGFDAAAGWTRDTTSNRTGLDSEWVEPFELLPGVWVFAGTGLAFGGSSPVDTVFEGFEVRGQSLGWGFADTITALMLAGDVYVRDCTLVGGNPLPTPDGIEVDSSVSIVMAGEGVHFEDVLITGGSATSCTALSAVAGEVTLERVTVEGVCDGASWLTGLITSTGSIQATDTVVELGDGVETATGVLVESTGQLFATGSIIRVEATGQAVALDVSGQDARVELKSSAFAASSTGAALGRGARVQDDATLIAAGVLLDGGGGDDTVAVEAASGKLTLVNSLLSGGTSPTATALSLTSVTDVTLVANNFWSPGPSVLLDESGFQVTDVTSLDQCSWSACREARLNTDVDPLFESVPTAPYSVAPTSPAVDSGVDPSPYGLVVVRDIAGLIAPSDGDGDSIAEFDRGPHER